jgi:hypothetical protein
VGNLVNQCYVLVISGDLGWPTWYQSSVWLQYLLPEILG